VADGWKAAGAHVTFFNLPPALANVLENRVTRPGAGIYAVGETRFPLAPHSKNIGSERNRWSGNNYGGYNNPSVDALIDRLEITIPPDERAAILREMLTTVMGDVVMWPMYWDLTNVLALKHVKGIRTGEGGYHTWNMFEWDRS
jgi:peptide/nickel transport system substrate-binding protein